MSQPHKRSVREVTFKGIDVHDLATYTVDKVKPLLNARMNRKLKRGLSQKHLYFLAKLRARRNAPAGQKAKVIKTHLRDMLILPEMIGATIAVYNGRLFNPVEIKPQMVGRYLAEFSLSYKPVKHGRVGIGATRSSKFVPLR